MKFIFILIFLLFPIKAFCATNPKSPDLGRQTYNVINVKNSKQDTTKTEEEEITNEEKL